MRMALKVIQIGTCQARRWCKHSKARVGTSDSWFIFIYMFLRSAGGSSVSMSWARHTIPRVMNTLLLLQGYLGQDRLTAVTLFGPTVCITHLSTATAFFQLTRKHMEKCWRINRPKEKNSQKIGTINLFVWNNYRGHGWSSSNRLILLHSCCPSERYSDRWQKIS